MHDHFQEKANTFAPEELVVRFRSCLESTTGVLVDGNNRLKALLTQQEESKQDMVSHIPVYAVFPVRLQDLMTTSIGVYSSLIIVWLKQKTICCVGFTELNWHNKPDLTTDTHRNLHLIYQINQAFQIKLKEAENCWVRYYIFVVTNEHTLFFFD